MPALDTLPYGYGATVRLWRYRRAMALPYGYGALRGHPSGRPAIRRLHERGTFGAIRLLRPGGPQRPVRILQASPSGVAGLRGPSSGARSVDVPGHLLRLDQGGRESAGGLLERFR